MNLLVTGAAGFIGSNFVRYIYGNPDVEHIVSVDCLTYAGNIDNLPRLDEDPKHTLIKTNIRSGGEMIAIFRKHKITHVVHCAAESHVDRSIEGPEAFIETNIKGTFNLLEACRKHPVEMFLQVSTDEVYGSIDHGSFTEDSPLNPSSPYSASKAAADMLCIAYHKTYGIPTVITRCVNNYGPHQHQEKLIPMVIKKALASEYIPVYGDGSNVRDWIHVLDHCEALCSCLWNGEPGQIYNLSGDNEITNLDLVKEILKVCGADESLITFVKDRPGHDKRYAIGGTRSRLRMGWSAQIPFDTGLMQTVNWYRSYFGYTTEAQPLCR